MHRYVAALQGALLAPVEDYPWIDCVDCGVHAACGSSEAPDNLDFNLLANYAFAAIFAADNKRCITLNRLPGRADGSNCNWDVLNGSKLTHNLGAHRYPGAWVGDSGTGLSPIANSIALFPAAAAAHLWVHFSVDLANYANSDPPFSQSNAVRYVRFLQFGVFSPIFRPHDGGTLVGTLATTNSNHTVLLPPPPIPPSTHPTPHAWTYSVAAAASANQRRAYSLGRRK
jgi:hypothetical protein